MLKLNYYVRKTSFIIFLFVAVTTVRTQERKGLQKIRQEIRQLELDLKAKEVREKTFLEQVEDIDRQVGLQRKLLQELELQRRERGKRIRVIEIRLNETIRSYNKLKELVARRMVSMYKRGKMMNWEALLSINSLSQILVWVKYQKMIVDNDRRNLRLILKKKADIQAQKQGLDKTLRESNQLIQEKNAEANKLEEKKDSREKLLSRVRQDKQLTLERLRRTRMAYKEIENRISREEEKRKSSVENIRAPQFVALKGKMDWPVKGKVVSKYGRQKHPVLKTITENRGIDIEGGERDVVRAVSWGKVKWVTWQRGMGNLVLLDHGGGYYTVYGHLDVVWVDSGEKVDKGEVIGQIGDRQGLNGSTLYFGIWKGTTHYNPEFWLR